MRRSPKRTTLRPPLQARSQATLDRLVRAAEGLLAEKRFDEATVAEIARRADSSIGAFYARFPDKEAFLDHFDERFFESARKQWDVVLDPARWEGETAAHIVSEIVGILVQKNRAYKPLLRALALYARTSPDPRFLERSRRLNEHVFAGLRRLLLSRERPDHPRPGPAVDLGLTMVAAALRDIQLFGERPESCDLDGEALAAEMTRALLSYLGLGKGRHGRRIRRRA